MAIVRPASTDPTYAPATGAPGAITYTVVVTCPALPGCASSDDLVVTVALGSTLATILLSKTSRWQVEERRATFEGQVSARTSRLAA